MLSLTTSSCLGAVMTCEPEFERRLVTATCLWSDAAILSGEGVITVPDRADRGSVGDVDDDLAEDIAAFHEAVGISCIGEFKYLADHRAHLPREDQLQGGKELVL